MRSFIVTVFCLGIRYQFTTLATGSCEAILAAMDAYPQADTVGARPITVH